MGEKQEIKVKEISSASCVRRIDYDNSSSSVVVYVAHMETLAEVIPPEKVYGRGELLPTSRVADSMHRRCWYITSAPN